MTQAVWICGHGVKLMLICLQVMFFCAVPAPANILFSIHLHFYCCCHPLHSSKMALLADSSGVRVCVQVKMSQVSLVKAYNYNKRYVGGPREWMKYVLNCSRLWEWLSSLPDSQHPPWPLRHHRWYPGTGQPPVRASKRSSCWLPVQSWVLPHWDMFNVPGKVSSVTAKCLRHSPSTPALRSVMNVSLECS